MVPIASNAEVLQGRRLCVVFFLMGALLLSGLVLGPPALARLELRRATPLHVHTANAQTVRMSVASALSKRAHAAVAFTAETPTLQDLRERAVAAVNAVMAHPASKDGDFGRVRSLLNCSETLLIRPGTERIEKDGRSWVMPTFPEAEIRQFISSVLPEQIGVTNPSTAGYFTKNSDMVSTCAAWKAKTGGCDPCTLALFPGRLFALIDFYEWNETHNFLHPQKVLSLFPDDAEMAALDGRCGTYTPPVVDTWIYGKHPEIAHWGDLQHPISAAHAGEYDLVLFAQTLEHLYNPQLGIKNVFDALAPGGFVFTSVPMLNHLHMVPIFFTEPTPFGLAMWFKTAGFEVLHVGQYGSEEYMHNLATNVIWWPKWHTYLNVSRRPQIVNDATRPVQTWILARRPNTADLQ